MFWLPRKTIFTGPRKQRGNICVELGLPPQYLPDVTGDLGGGWTAENEWTTETGDLSGIESAMTFLRADGIAWSPDGSTLTLTNMGDDVIYSFNCSTPWDPNTASLVTSRGVTNANGLVMNEAGTLLFSLTVVGDQISSYPCTNHRINTSGTAKHMTKGDVGFSGSADGSFSASFDLQTVIWNGTDGGDAAKRISVPSGDLDSPTVNQTYVNAAINPSAANGESQVTLDGKTYLKCLGSQGFAFRRMSTAWDLSTVASWSDNQSVQSITTLDFRPEQVWFNPKDTRYVWAKYDGSGFLRMVQFATNTPEQ